MELKNERQIKGGEVAREDREARKKGTKAKFWGCNKSNEGTYPWGTEGSNPSTVFFKDFVMYSRWQSSENKLAKFGYVLDTKVEKQSKSFNILGYLQEIIVKILGF